MCLGCVDYVSISKIALSNFGQCGIFILAAVWGVGGRGLHFNTTINTFLYLMFLSKQKQNVPFQRNIFYFRLQENININGLGFCGV